MFPETKSMTRSIRKELMLICRFGIQVRLNLAIGVHDLNIQVVHTLLRPCPSKFDGSMRLIDVVQKLIEFLFTTSPHPEDIVNIPKYGLTRAYEISRPF